MMDGADQAKWDRIYRDSSAAKAAAPCRVLTDQAHLLPDTGDALDLACGRGGNALYLAARGYPTQAWDISAVAIQALAAQVSHAGLPLSAQQRDASARPPEPESFDIIVISRFLDRSLAPALCAALREQGLLYYQTFIREQVSDTGPKNPAYRLRANELLRLFSSLHVLHYHEEGNAGDRAQGFRNEAMLVAQKRG